MKRAAVFFFLLTAALSAQVPAIQTGPEVGSSIPAFSVVDQYGKTFNQHSVLGPKGALLVFFRSADW